MALDYLHVNDLATATLDDTDQIIVGEGNTFKKATLANLRGSIIGSDAEYTEDTVPYLSARQTKNVGIVGKVAMEQLVGGSLGWNQLCNGSSVTVLSGHKYYMKKSGTASIGASTGSAITGLTSGTDMVIDLTATFGSTIADYIYSLETATAGTGIAWLSRYIDLGTYHAYDAGSIQSVQATAHVTTGFNQWDEKWELGYWGINGGSSATNQIRTKNYIPILPNTSYYIKSTATSKKIYYDGNYRYVTETGWTNRAFITPSNVRYMMVNFGGDYGAVYNNDICINISKTTGSPKNGDYVPFNGYTYSLGSDTLRGIPQLVDGELAYDGDEKTADGTITRKYGVRAYQSGDVSDGSTMLTDGTNTVYKLATPTTESSTPYQRIQTVDADGTESFTTSTPVPVGHKTLIPENVLGALSILVG